MCSARKRPHTYLHTDHGTAAWLAARGQATQRTYLHIVDPRENRHGGVHKGGLKSGVHPSVHLTRSVKLLLRGQEGWRSEALHRLPVLNDQTVKFAYPLPLVPATLEELRGSCIFSKLDLRSAYNLIRIRRGDEWKTAFVTPTGHYEYRVMPYGLSNSPSIFQNFMHEIFRDMINRFVLIYIDDILIYSPTIEELRRHVTQVLQRLRQHHLYLKTEKCEFHKFTIHFLGYIVTPAGVQMDQRKVEAVRNWPQPTTIKEMQRF